MTKWNKRRICVDVILLIFIIFIFFILTYSPCGDPGEARVQKAKVDIKTMEAALKMFKIDNGFFPTTEQGLEALMYKPIIGESAKNYKVGGYIESLPFDPWDNAYIYISPGINGEPYEIMTYGADGAEGGSDNAEDISNWNIRI